MYSSVKNPGINWKDLLLKLLFLILFVILIVLLMPKAPKMEPFYSNVFRENINYMKESAKDYFTNERLPENLNDSVKITLREMIEKNIIIPFIDKDGNTCDEDLSYAKVTKNEEEYTLEIKLVCNTEKNTLNVSLGCYDYCDDCNKCESCEQEIIEIIEYEFKKGTSSNKTFYSCPNGYNLDGKVCKKTTISSKKEAIKNYKVGKTITVKAKENKGDSYKVYTDKITELFYTYTCPSGYTKNETSNGILCTKTKVENKTPICEDGTLTGTGANATCKITTYEYEDPQCKKGELINGYCYYDNTITKASECKNGTLTNGVCVIEKITTKDPTCPTGYDLNPKNKKECLDSKTTKIDAICENKTLTLNKNTELCEGSKTETAAKNKCTGAFSYNNSTKRCEYSAKANYKTETSTSTYYVYDSCSSTSTKKCTYLGMVTLTDCGVKCPRVAKKYKVTETTSKSVFSHYSCPNGGNVSGSICYQSATCPTGYSPNSSGSCSGTFPITETPKCSEGTRSGAYCLLTEKLTAKSECEKGTYNNNTGKCDIVTKSEETPQCPSKDYALSKDGKTCTLVEEVKSNPTCSSGTLTGSGSNRTCKITNTSYSTPSCESGFALVNGVCQKTTTTTELANAIENYSYSCPSGYSKEGSGSSLKCYQTKYNDSTYYCENANATLNETNKTCTYKEPDKFSHYSCESSYKLSGNYCYKTTEEKINATSQTKTITNYTYKWSTEEFLEGWERTGKTRTVNSETEILIQK